MSPLPEMEGQGSRASAVCPFPWPGAFLPATCWQRKTLDRLIHPGVKGSVRAGKPGEGREGCIWTKEDRVLRQRAQSGQVSGGG